MRLPGQSWALIATALALFLGLPAPSSADGYPSRPIRIVVPFAPGGAVDAVARLDAQYLTSELGQQVFVDNRGGAGGTIGSAFVAKVRPDGYTLRADPLSSAVINGLVYKHLPYDPRHDFAAIAELAETPTARHQCGAAGDDAAAIHRARQAASGRIQFRLNRRWQQRSARRRPVRHEGRRQTGPCAVSRRRPGSGSVGCRADTDAGRFNQRLFAVHSCWQASCLVHQQRPPQSIASRRAHGSRG
jgi:hypothetical protein